MKKIQMWAILFALAFICAGGQWAVAEETHGHEPAHGGCLNELGACENGHAEVKVEGNIFKLWFVGGGTNTKTAVRVPDKQIALTVKTEKNAADKQIVLKAKPLALAEEKVGDCSYFEGQADWLKGLKEFSAEGTVNFKGLQIKMKIEYPQGYDPDHDEPATKEKTK
jgi:hypothetical protein